MEKKKSIICYFVSYCIIWVCYVVYIIYNVLAKFNNFSKGEKKEVFYFIIIIMLCVEKNTNTILDYFHINQHAKVFFLIPPPQCFATLKQVKMKKIKRNDRSKY